MKTPTLGWRPKGGRFNRPSSHIALTVRRRATLGSHPAVLGSETRQGTRRGRGPNLQAEKYDIAVAQGSPLREQINETLLALYDDGKYDEIRAKWFAASG